VRRIKTWTQAELAQATKTTRANICLYENGRRVPRPRTLERILAVVNMPLSAACSLAAWDRLLTEALCPGQAAWRLPDPSVDPPETHRAMTEMVDRAVHRLRLELALLQQRSDSLWDRLRRLEPRSRSWLVAEDLSYRRSSFCLWLCDESERRAADDAEEARELAELAVTLARQLRQAEPGNRFFIRLEGQSEAILANALRVLGQLGLAAAAFGRAWSLWKEGSDEAHLLSEARTLDLEASLRRAQRNFERALALHAAAFELARPDEVATILLNQAMTLEVMGDHASALAVLARADSLIDANSPPRLRLALRHNQALNLVRLGRAEEAQPAVAEARRLAEQLSNGLDSARTAGLGALVDAGLGRAAVAIEALEKLCGDFDERGYAFDYALVALDLALLYWEEKRWAEIRVLADRMVGIFRERKIHRETLAAVILFREAATKEAVSHELVRRLRDYLKQAQAQPGLRFEP
jgi:tetratricopeptide (TPR) repeat protein/DNA-binding XRE family transcriptional regulator